MKQILILISIFTIIISCNNSDGTKENNRDTISKISIENKQVIKTDTVKEAEIELNFIDNYKYLSDIFQKEDSLYSDFEKYLALLNSEMSSEEQINEVFIYRNKINEYASLKVDKYYYSKGENNQELWQKVEKELISIGFLPIYLEGMYVYLDKAPILNDAINKYASDPFKLKFKFDNEYAKVAGGEYPYAGLEEYFNAFEPAYKLFNKYKSTRYYKDIEVKFKTIITEFADIHKVGDECFEGSLHSEFYPWSANCEVPKLFVDKFPNTVFTPVFKNIINDMSFFETKRNIYLVVTDTVAGGDIYEKAQNIVFSYLEKGIDVVHSVKIKNNEDKYVNYIVYRFYSNKSKADSALVKIKEIVTDAKIIPVIVDEKEVVKEI